MRKRILPLLIAIGLTMSVSVSTLAGTLTQQLNSQQNKLLQQQGSYNLAQTNSDKLEVSIEMLDSNIENIYSGIDKAKSEINNTQKNIDQSTKDIAVAENNIKGEEALFNERMRAMFMNGADSYVEILLDSKGVEDLISRVENVKKIVEYDNKIIKELNDKKEAIEVRKKALNDNKMKVLTLKADNENKLDKLTITKKEQSQLIVEAKKQQELNKNKMAETQTLVDGTAGQIKEAADQKRKYDLAIATKKTAVITPSRGSVSTSAVAKTETKTVAKVQTKAKENVQASTKTYVQPKAQPKTQQQVVKQVSQPKQTSSTSSNAIIAYAQTFLGTPYVWGANGPNSFDCSGFTKYVYAHFGIGMGRTTYDQITQGQYVSRENLQAGDLVFFGSGSPHHVGIYMGNGNYIHAPHTGDVVKISQLTRTDYMSARRFK
ncbi:NlpC/P60 family protein [Clostridium algoriphilum]|uniref:C40 family peptidase n=1 Tax=Clostridium algoriphilum TaxID=198347 RepID=UPI001CF11F9D|nr:C40 family peptidase [Clostridium algoriphilum]MCB2294031.1 NlpC/P60 family protein [Clostridium algoriphilum]